MKKKDFIFIIILTAVCAVLLAVRLPFIKAGNTVSVYVNSELFKELPLDKNCEIDINGTNTAIIENGYVYMKNASCPDKLCVNMGRISDNSRDIVCLPNNIVIKISSKSDVDTVSN